MKVAQLTGWATARNVSAKAVRRVLSEHAAAHRKGGQDTT